MKKGGVFAKFPVQADTTTTENVYQLLQTFLQSDDQSEVEAEATKELAKKEWTPTDQEQYMVKVLNAILKPFFDATTTLSREKYPTIGLAITVFRRIRDVLEKIVVKDKVFVEKVAIDDKTIAAMSDCLETLLESFSTNFSSLLGVNPPLMWTIPLDPRLIHMKGLSDSEKESVDKLLVEKVKEWKLVALKKEEQEEGESDEKKKNKDDDDDDEKTQQESSTMGGIFWGDDTEDNTSNNNTTERIAAYARGVVDRYFGTVKSSQRRIDDPLGWWNANQSQFPELSQMARTWLGASATFEGSGSSSSSSDQQKRRREYPEDNLEIVAFLHDNSDLI
jgi:hypothetical protein